MSSALLAIRPAVLADAPAIGRLGALLVRMHHDFDPQRFLAAMPQTEERYGAYLGTQLAKPDIVILVAEKVAERVAGRAAERGEVVGYTYAGLEGTDYMALRGPAGAIYDLVVDPGHRRQGIGGALLESTISVLEAKGAPRVVLSTAEKNETAQRLFARAGFRRTMIEMTRESGAGAPP
jgi:ribosomal protein S18 acetylase RimI-like enzyme